MTSAREIIVEFGRSWPRAVALAVPLSLATRIEPALVRRVRLALVPDADVSDEAALWSGPLVADRGPSYVVLRAEVVQELREDLEASGTLEDARRLLLQTHRGLPPLLQLEEELTYLALSGASEQDIDEELGRAFVAMTSEGRKGIADWFDRALAIAPSEVRRSEVAQRLAARASRVRRSAADDGDAVSEAWGWLPPDQPRRPLGVRLAKGGSLEIGSTKLTGATTVEAPHSEPVWVQVGWSELDGRGERYESREVFEDSLARVRGVGEEFSLRFADGRQVRLERRTPEIGRWLSKLESKGVDLYKLARDLELVGDLEAGPRLPSRIHRALQAFRARNGFAAGARVGPKLLALLEREVERKAAQETHGGPEVFLARLPRPTGGFHGRTEALGRLDRAWKSGANLIQVVGLGGSGKTALVGEWLRRMESDGYRGAERVVYWSFYEEGTGRAASADAFLAAVLEWLDESGVGKAAPMERAARLVKHLRSSRSLLVLDGLEALQRAPGGPDGGELADPSIAKLLRELAAGNPGLCVVTSRLELPLGSFAAELLRLDRLSDREGADMLLGLGIRGTAEELEQVSRGVDGHPLTLSLMAGLARERSGGDARGLLEQLAGPSTEITTEPRAADVMRSYEQYLSGRPELAVLQLLALFRRPADPEALAALRRALTGTSLPRVPDRVWPEAVESLTRLGLVTADSGASGPLDCHALVREYWAKKLRAELPEVWKHGHEVLYEHYSRTAEREPETLEALDPLLEAVVHGCAAGHYAETFREVLVSRILRGGELHALFRLGAVREVLAALAPFFNRAWIEVVPDLEGRDRGFLLNVTAVCLRSLGRLTEAVEPMRATLEQSLEQEDWRNASVGYSNLSVVRATLGELAEAERLTRLAIQAAERTGDARAGITSMTVRASVLHRLGFVEEAEALFREAESQSQRIGEAFVASGAGYEFSKLLLTQGKLEVVRERSKRALEHSVAMGSRLEAALAYLSLGLALFERGDPESAREHVDGAVQGLRQAGQAEHLVWALVGRAKVRRRLGELDRARADLDEALTLAVRGSMRLAEADVCLEQARLQAEAGDVEAGREALHAARLVIESTGYALRRSELLLLEEKIGESPPPA